MVRCGPFDELDDDPVGVGDLEQAFSPWPFAQWHRDVDAYGTQSFLLGFEAGDGDGEGEDQSAGLPVALVGRQDADAPPEQDDVDGGIVTGEEANPSAAACS